MKHVLRPRRLLPCADPEAPEARGPRPLAALVAEAYARLSLRSRARMLGRLIASVGSLALAVVGGGAFAKYITASRGGYVAVPLEDAARTTSTQIYELARYVEQSNPRLFASLVDEIARTLGGLALPRRSPA